LVNELDTIFKDDQKYRQDIMTLMQKYGDTAKQVLNMAMKMRHNDSIDLIKIEAILDKYGWPSPKLVGEAGCGTVWVVIQHSDLKTQERYLPMMRDAVKKGDAKASDLALLIDRIEVRNDRPQIFGSQLKEENGKYVLYPIKDEMNVDKRRDSVGLPKLEEYVKYFGLEYKLPAK
jgi:hypothetical protein